MIREDPLYLRLLNIVGEGFRYQRAHSLGEHAPSVIIGLTASEAATLEGWLEARGA